MISSQLQQEKKNEETFCALVNSVGRRPVDTVRSFPSRRIFTPGHTAPPLSPPSLPHPPGRRCQPDESLSHGFIDGQSRLRRRLECQVDCQADTRVAAANSRLWTRTSVGPGDPSGPAGSRKSCGFQQVPTSPCRVSAGSGGPLPASHCCRGSGDSHPRCDHVTM